MREEEEKRRKKRDRKEEEERRLDYWISLYFFIYLLTYFPLDISHFTVAMLVFHLS